MMRRAVGYARPPDAEARERAPEPGKGQAQLPRAARRSESTSETRSGMRALEWLQKWLSRLYGLTTVCTSKSYYEYYSYCAMHCRRAAHRSAAGQHLPTITPS